MRDNHYGIWLDKPSRERRGEKRAKAERLERLLRFAWLPVPLFLILLAAASLLSLPVMSEPVWLRPILNFVFGAVIALWVSWLAARCFLQNASGAILLFSSAMLLHGSSAFLASLAFHHFRELNLGVTIHSIGLCLTGVTHLAVAVLTWTAGDWVVRKPGPMLAAAFAATLLIVAGYTGITFTGMIPAFLDSEGPTPVRRGVLLSAVVAFALAATLIIAVSQRRIWNFGKWYGYALSLLATGIFGVSFTSQVGGPFEWIGRTAQYLAGIYFLAAALTVLFDRSQWDVMTYSLLRASEERFRTLAEATFEGVVITKNGAIVDTNKPFGAMLGYAVSELIGRSVAAFLPPDASQAWMQQIPSDSEVDQEHALVRKDGTQIFVESHKRILPAQNRAIQFLIVRDITVRKKYEQALQRSREELEHLVQERTAELRQRADQLARLASELTLAEDRERRRLAQFLHDDLQQLLVGAKYSLHRLSGQLSGPAQHGLVEIENLLNESINASRSLTMELSPPILHQAELAPGLEWLARWMKKTHGLTVDLTVDPGLAVDREDVRLFLFQAVRELLFNVAKHARTDRAEVQISRHDPTQLLAVVEDRGVGFDPAKIFGPGNTDPEGFGLFSIRERIDLLGGSLQAESLPGRGARFTLLAPLDDKSRQTCPR